MPITIAADILFFISKKIRLDISCESRFSKTKMNEPYFRLFVCYNFDWCLKYLWTWTCTPVDSCPPPPPTPLLLYPRWTVEITSVHYLMMLSGHYVHCSNLTSSTLQTNAYSVETNATAHKPSHQDLHCLPLAEKLWEEMVKFLWHKKVVDIFFHWQVWCPKHPTHSMYMGRTI